MANENPQLSIILPCLNEEQALGPCLDKIEVVIQKNNLKAEIIVVDNGSTDNSCNIAREKNARLIHQKQTGYGFACLSGFVEAQGKFLFLADCDGSYDFNEIPAFIEQLRTGYDFVIGNRFKGRIEKKAMPWTHQYIGNPMLSGILRLFFRTKISDAHCGMRALTKEAFKKLNLKATGMEFASEMVIKALRNNLRIKELSISYHRRRGKSKLNSFADGWRHLRFMLLYSPLFLFFLPGLVLSLTGLALMLWMYLGSPQILGMKLYYHPIFLSSLLIITGYQLIIFGLFTKTYAITHLGAKPIFAKFYKYISIEKAGTVGALAVILGIIIYVSIFSKWINTGFGHLSEAKNSILALTLIVIGIQTVFSSFMLSILDIKEK